MTMRTPPLRQIPGDSPVHRMWAGTKLIVVLVLGLLTWVLPSWPALGFVAVCVLVFVVAAGIPLGALPRPPWWFWGLLVAGGAVTAFSSGLDGVIVYLRATLLGLIVLAMSVLVIWTTAMADIAPAISRLMSPLKLLRCPVDEWAVTIALSLRALPMVIDEMRMLYAAQRMRPKSRADSGHPSAEMSVVDILSAALSSAMRRTAEMAEAITARGGTGRLTAYPSRPGKLDAAVLAALVLASAGAITATILW